MLCDLQNDFQFDLLLITTNYIDTVSNFAVVLIFAYSQLWFLFSLSLFFVGLTWLLFVIILIQSLKHANKHDAPILSELKYFFWLPLSWNLIPLAIYADYKRKYSVNRLSVSDTTPLTHHRQIHYATHSHTHNNARIHRRGVDSTPTRYTNFVTTNTIKRKLMKNEMFLLNSFHYSQIPKVLLDNFKSIQNWREFKIHLFRAFIVEMICQSIPFLIIKIWAIYTHKQFSQSILFQGLILCTIISIVIKSFLFSNSIEWNIYIWRWLCIATDISLLCLYISQSNLFIIHYGYTTILTNIGDIWIIVFILGCLPITLIYLMVGIKQREDELLYKPLRLFFDNLIEECYATQNDWFGWILRLIVYFLFLLSFSLLLIVYEFSVWMLAIFVFYFYKYQWFYIIIDFICVQRFDLDLEFNYANRVVGEWQMLFDWIALDISYLNNYDKMNKNLDLKIFSINARAIVLPEMHKIWIKNHAITVFENVKHWKQSFVYQIQYNDKQIVDWEPIFNETTDRLTENKYENKGKNKDDPTGVFLKVFGFTRNFVNNQETDEKTCCFYFQFIIYGLIDILYMFILLPLYFMSWIVFAVLFPMLMFCLIFFDVNMNVNENIVDLKVGHMTKSATRINEYNWGGYLINFEYVKLISHKLISCIKLDDMKQQSITDGLKNLRSNMFFCMVLSIYIIFFMFCIIYCIKIIKIGQAMRDIGRGFPVLKLVRPHWNSLPHSVSRGVFKFYYFHKQHQMIFLILEPILGSDVAHIVLKHIKPVTPV